MVDKNLFLYDLAVVAIMKNEAPYIREWLDYHLLAGVNHFYIYDNEDSEVQKQVLQPYIERGIVTHIPYSGKARQLFAYNDAFKKYRFFCRYMAIIDGDEFIFPQSNKSIVEVLDEILSDKPQAGGIGINWHCFGSNFQERADYNCGVLERFTRRAETNWAPIIPEINNSPGGNAHVKTVTNPRKVDYTCNQHCHIYFENFFNVNENGGIIPFAFNYPPTIDKIRINHYHTKSREEFENKIRRGNADSPVYRIPPEQFLKMDRNEIFDDGILKYREARRKGGVIDTEINFNRLYSALLMNLSPTFAKNIPLEFFFGKMENFLTCRAVAAVLRENVLTEAVGNFFEEAALNAVYKTLFTQVLIPDLRLFFSELPNILVLNYSVVEQLRAAAVGLAQQMTVFQADWKAITDWDYLIKIFQTFDSYKHK